MDPVKELEQFKAERNKFPMSALIEGINVDKTEHLYTWNFKSAQLWDDTDPHVVKHGVTLSGAFEFLRMMGVEIRSVCFE